MTAAEAVRTDSTVAFTVDLERTGEAAWLGRARVQVVDAGDRVLAQQEDVLSVYRTLRRRFVFPADSVAGAVRVRYVLDNERPELGQGNIITARPVQGETAVR